MDYNKVYFQKPEIKKLVSQGYSCYDMHFHTQYSDTRTKLKLILKKAARQNTGLAITDHNEIKGAVLAVGKKTGVPIIPGMEVTTRGGYHILLYFYDVNELKEFYTKYIHPKKGKNPNSTTNIRTVELLDLAKAYNCVTAAAHPLGFGLNGLYKALKKGMLERELTTKIDALEVLNSSQPKFYNNRAIELNKKLRKPMIGGSDGHTIMELNNALTCTVASDVDQFLHKVLRKKAFIVGKSASVFNHVFHHSESIMQHAKYPITTFKNQSRIFKKFIKKRKIQRSK
ncbi:PHP domain-containing protein [Candidatus Woesearchaeota archaeon]|nr:PHP domain-containing protein [Candidatus Woesearchaeota archaeon]